MWTPLLSLVCCCCCYYYYYCCGGATVLLGSVWISEAWIWATERDPCQRLLQQGLWNLETLSPTSFRRVSGFWWSTMIPHASWFSRRCFAHVSTKVPLYYYSIGLLLFSVSLLYLLFERLLITWPSQKTTKEKQNKNWNPNLINYLVISFCFLICWFFLWIRLLLTVRCQICNFVSVVEFLFGWYVCEILGYFFGCGFSYQMQQSRDCAFTS